MNFTERDLMYAGLAAILMLLLFEFGYIVAVKERGLDTPTLTQHNGKNFIQPKTNSKGKIKNEEIHYCNRTEPVADGVPSFCAGWR